MTRNPFHRTATGSNPLKARLAGWQGRLDNALPPRPSVNWLPGGARGPLGINLVPYTGSASRSASARATKGPARGRLYNGNGALRYGAAGLSGLAGIGAAGNAYSALQNGRIGSALANGAFAVGAGITSYQLAMGEGAMFNHFQRGVKILSHHANGLGRTFAKNAELKQGKMIANKLFAMARWMRG